MMRRGRGLAVALFLASAACDKAASPTQPSPPVSSTPPVAASISGSGRLLAAGTIDVVFAVDAARHIDGSVSGTFLHRRSDLDAVHFGRVTCLAFDAANRRAWIGGVLASVTTTNPRVLEQPGEDVWFRVLDTDFAAGGKRSTVMGFKGAAGFDTSTQYCDGRPWPDNNDRTWPLVEGTMTVRF